MDSLSKAPTLIQAINEGHDKDCSGPGDSIAPPSRSIHLPLSIPTSFPLFTRDTTYGPVVLSRNIPPCMARKTWTRNCTFIFLSCAIPLLGGSRRRFVVFYWCAARIAFYYLAWGSLEGGLSDDWQSSMEIAHAWAGRRMGARAAKEPGLEIERFTRFSTKANSNILTLLSNLFSYAAELCTC